MVRAGLLVCLAGVLLILAVSCRQVPPDGVLIANVTVVDARNGVRPGMDVIIREERISEVLTHKDGRAKEVYLTIDGAGKYLIPGLWDAHVHLTYTPGLDHETFFPLSLAYGVTSLRDTGGHLDQLAEARALAETNPLTPDLYVSGPLIDGPLRVYAGVAPGFPDLSVGAGSIEDAEKIVDDLADAGVAFVKAYEMLPEPIFKAVVARATERGLPVVLHSPLSMTPIEAARAGAGDMQHLRNLEFGCVPNPEGLRDERRSLLDANEAEHPGALRRNIHQAQRGDVIASLSEGACDPLIAVLAEEQVYQTPTLTISRFLTRKLFLEDAYRQTFDLVPETIGSGWKERSLALAEAQPSDADVAYDVWLQELLVDLEVAGVPVMAGTDAPIGFLTPGASLHEELTLLVDAGLTPLQAIEAATLAPASFLGLGDELGAIEPGMKADLVLLNADPLADIRNTQNIETVMKGGMVIDRVMLDALLQVPSTLTQE